MQPEEKEIIAAALECYWTKCINNAVRKRTQSDRQYSFKQMQQKERISEEWHDKANEVKKVLDKYIL